MIDRVVLLVRIAIRNLLASPINLLIGGLILLGTMIFVLLGGMLDSLNQAMQRSVVGSLAGHLQIYSAASKDELALFGQMGNFPDLPAINDFPKIQDALSKVDNVKVVVPMGISAALITSGNIVDTTLEKLRNLYKARDGQAVLPPNAVAPRGFDPKLEGVPKEELERRIASEISHVRQIIKVLRGDVEKAMADMISAKSVEPRNVEALARVETEAFWADFEREPYANLEFLENRIAPIVTDTSLVFLRYVGTDLDKFQKSFDRMRVVKGTPVPQGQRGFLIADLMHEDQMKLKTARRLDKLKDARANGRLIATDDELKRFVKENRHQTRELVLQLDGIKTAALVTSLQGALGSKETGIDVLLSQLLDTTDENFDTRYQQFYELVVPQVQLYRVKVGDMLTIKAFTKSGYIQNVNVKVYGTFAFTGLEKSPLAGATSLMDLMSFRELFGYLTSDKAEELKEIQRDTGAKTVSRENAEAELFGEGADEVIAEATPGIIDPDAALAGTGRKLREEDLIRRVYTQQQLDDGVVLHAAVMLEDPGKLDETIAKIQQAAKDQNLGIQVVSWQKASGLLGQIINVFRALLFVAVGIIFIAAMLIMYLSVLMATLQRTQMFGTMRAIGAQRGMILSMVLIESLVLGVIFGGLGMVAGSGVLALIASKGIAAPNDVMYFFFSGPRLIPQLSTWPLVVAMVIILVVTIGSTLLPALMAMRVSPLRAMQADE